MPSLYTPAVMYYMNMLPKRSSPPDLGPIKPDRPPFWRRHRGLLIFLVVAILAGGGVTAYGALYQSYQTN
jgi:hypothetical protein